MGKTYAQSISWLIDIFKKYDRDLLTERQEKILSDVLDSWVLGREEIMIKKVLTKYKEKEVFDLLKHVLHTSTEIKWKQIGEKGNSLQDILNKLWIPLKEEGFEFTYKLTRKTLKMKCTKCPHVEEAKKRNVQDLYKFFFCGLDEPIVKGFNQKIKFTRTKCLMDGDPCCNHKYELKE